MCLLTDTDIKKILCTEKDWTNKNKIHIYPYDPESLTPVGYDVRIGKQYASSKDAKLYDLKENDQVIIKPGDIVLVTTLENIDMPNDRSISAFITSKVSKVSQGLSHISTNIDPDWKGKLLIAIHNPSHDIVNLKYGERFCTLNFIKNISPSTKECGKESGRTDILLKQFVKHVQSSREREKRKIKHHYWLSYAIKVGLILASSLSGFYLFKNTTGFVAMTALGVGIASNISWPRKES